MNSSIRNKSLLPLAAALLLAAHSAHADNTGTGGTITYTDASGANPRSSPAYTGGYVIHKFIASGTLNVPDAVTADVLVVAGGGGGGKFGGGGGAGGLIYNTLVSVAAGNTTVTVGAGGAGDTTADGTGGKGGDSQFGALPAAVGGGGGGSRSGTNPYPGVNGAAGGSGGGASASDSTTVVTLGGAATAGQGNAGGNGRTPAASTNWGSGGGGGAGALGGNATGNGNTSTGGAGGAGLAYSITGSNVFYAGGGGGATFKNASSGTAGAGGSGVGGAGGKNASGSPGTANTGGGGGGGDTNAGQNGGTGGSGIVIVRYPYMSGPDVTPPAVATLSPADNATNVAASTNLVVTFSEAITIGTGDIILKNLTTATDTPLDISSGSPVVSVAGAVLTINPPADLVAGSAYAIQIPGTAIKDAAGNFFAGITDNTTWNFSTDGTPPTVVTLSPADNATNVAAATNLVVTFSEAITIGTGDIILKNLTTATDTPLDISSGSPVVSVAGAVLTINPPADLAAGSAYAIQIPGTAIKDTSGNFFTGIADNTTWNFSTDGTPPTVVTLSPADNAAFVTTGTNLVVTFNEAITIGTGNIILKNLTDATDTTLDITSGSPQVSVAGAVLTINPTADLTLGKNYAIQIPGTAIKDASGNNFAGIADNTTWNFTASISQVFSTTELAYAGDVSNSDLLNGKTATTTGWNTANGSTTPELNDGIHGRSYADAGNSVEGTWTTVGATAIYNLGTSTLGYTLTSIQTIAAWNGAGFGNQAYTVDIKLKGAGSYVTLAAVSYQPLGTGLTSPGASKITMIDPSGVLATGVEFIRFTANSVNGGLNGGAFVFREIDVVGSPTSDGIPPTIATLSPADDASAVPPSSNLTATFSENIALGTGNITIKNLDTLSDTVITLPDARVSVSGAVLTINPDTNLAASTHYAVQIDATAIDDLSGMSFAGIADDTTWDFTTGVPDLTAPTLVTLAPADNTTNVPIASNLVANFSENIAIGTGSITIKNLDTLSDTVITLPDARVSVSGVVLTINPSSDLAATTDYAVRIASGAITDLAGNSFAGIADDTTWNFTTAAAPLRIMCLGDSITTGYTNNPTWTHDFKFGYRSGLYTLLTNVGYNFLFVGGSAEPWNNAYGDPTRGGTYTPTLDLRTFGQDGHRGYGGASASTLQGNIVNWLNSDNPDIILLKIGTNGQDQTALNTLVNTIATTRPAARLIIAQIIPKYTYQSGIVTYNSYIRDTLLPAQQALGRNVTVVDQYAPFLTNPADLTTIDQSLFSNGINHPSNPGYDKMAQVWFNGIDALGLGPDTTPPVWASAWPKADTTGTAITTGFTVRAKTNETGTAYFVVLASGAAAPSSAQVKAGNNASDAPALKSGSLALTSNTEATGSVTGLSTATTYDVWFVAQDAVPNLQASPSKVSVTTLTPYYAWLAANSTTNTPENLKEYAFGTTNAGEISVNNPTSITLGQAPAMQIAGTAVSAVYARRQNYQASGITYKVKFSADLVTWFYSTDTVNLVYPGTPDLNNPAVISSDGEMDAVSIPFPLFIKTANGYEKTNAFMMIEVTTP